MKTDEVEPYLLSRGWTHGDLNLEYTWVDPLDGRRHCKGHALKLQFERDGIPPMTPQSTTTIPCPTCKGTKVVEDVNDRTHDNPLKTCPTCLGTGWMKQRQTESGSKTTKILQET